ncbi:energy transducer TonB [Rhodocyclus tenuis]|uniref:Colicin import membrane protein n=1 Tax=Rhodocyclus tenuis TaxID=1066 RepID=A0A840GCR9_RHOTE|nr:energy transducer TonB [Rhodocyclus tenuis]MBB4246039.1 colicin import membrane protein [Rhodocyclus tenuis]
MTGHIPATDADRRLEQLDNEQRDPGKRKALFLAAAVHLLLIGALVLGVQWKSQPPASVEVEVWRSVPPPAATPPEAKPEPKPEPRVEPKPEPKPEIKTPAKPDIAIKEEKKPKEAPKPEPKKEEPKKPEPKPEPKKQEAKPETKAEPKKPAFDPFANIEKETKQLDRQRELQRQRERADAEARQLDQLKAEQSAASRSRGLADYAGKVRGKIRGNIVLPPGIQGNPETIFEVTQLPSGEVLSVRIRKSSGNPALDAAVERAILKSSPLPKPDSAELFERVLKIPYRPFD